MLAEIFMLSVETDARNLKALTPRGNVARFVPIELPARSAGNGPPQQVDSNCLGARSDHLARSH